MGMHPDTACVMPRGIFAPHLFVVTTPKVITGRCRRPAVTLLLSTNGKPFRISVGPCAALETQAIVIAPWQDRCLHADGCDLVSVNVEPGHPHHGALLRMLGARPLALFAGQRFEDLRDEMRAVYEGGAGSEVAEPIAALLEAAGGGAGPGMDARIADVVRHIHAALPRKLRLGELAREAGLSEDRLSHLFAATIGTPLRSYVVWQRYKLALARLSQFSDLSALAYDCGFADAAHMTRTFVNFFGVPPSLLMRSGFVQDFPAPRVS